MTCDVCSCGATILDVCPLSLLGYFVTPRNVNTHTHTHTCTHTYVHTHTRAHTHTCTHTHVHTHIRAHTHTCTHTYVHTHTHMHTETATKTGMIILLGEISSKSLLDYQKIVRETVKEIGEYGWCVCVCVCVCMCAPACETSVHLGVT